MIIPSSKVTTLSGHGGHRPFETLAEALRLIIVQVQSIVYGIALAWVNMYESPSLVYPRVFAFLTYI